MVGRVPGDDDANGSGIIHKIFFLYNRRYQVLPPVWIDEINSFQSSVI